MCIIFWRSRLALPVALVLLLTSTTQAQRWEWNVNLTSAEFSDSFDGLATRGYAPLDFAVVEDGREARYSSVWQREPGVAWHLWRDMSAAGLDEQLGRLTTQGYVPTRLDGYSLGGEARFSAIWRREAGVRWEARIDLDRAAFVTATEAFTRMGLVPVAITAYTVGGQTRYGAIWRRRDVAWESRIDLTSADYQACFDRLAPQGYLPVDVSVYRADGQLRFAAIWERAADAAWEARHHLTMGDHDTFTREAAAEGYAPYLVASYRQGGGVRYAGAWRFAP